MVRSSSYLFLLPAQLCTYNELAVAVLRQQAQQLIVNPKPFLIDLTGLIVKVKLKWGMEYQGRLESSDAYMNLQLSETEEFIDGQFAGFLGEVLIRCNNVLYVQAAPMKEAEANEEMKDS